MMNVESCLFLLIVFSCMYDNMKGIVFYSMFYLGFVLVFYLF